MVFLPLVFYIYWLINVDNIKFQNAFILIASYIFYGWWDWRFLSLIAFSSLVDYLVGIGLDKTVSKTKRRLLLIISISVNIGILGFFKYFNFFVESLTEAFTFWGNAISDPVIFDIVLPVGISFYTFQTLSYSIDIYRRKLQPKRDIVSFFAFVSFFPQLVAGPIERATNLLPQFHNPRSFSYNHASNGMRQILWGLFKKIVIADNCAIHANAIFSNYTTYSGSTLLLGAIFFSFQIYGDFSGYSDIAIGTARLFGFKLMRNFAFPYFSRDIAEFWRRWHISLSTWFRDYLYIPLGGSRCSKVLNIRNVLIIFIVSGFWHGSNWTFVIWGTLHAIYFIPLMLFNRNMQHTNIVAEGKFFPNAQEILQMGTTFFLIIIAWIFFRSETVFDSLSYLSRMFTASFFSFPEIFPKKTIILVTIFILAEWIQRDKQHALEIDELNHPLLIRWIIYYVTIFLILQFGGEQQTFIYFQF